MICSDNFSYHQNLINYFISVRGKRNFQTRQIGFHRMFRISKHFRTNRILKEVTDILLWYGPGDQGSGFDTQLVSKNGFIFYLNGEVI